MSKYVWVKIVGNIIFFILWIRLVFITKCLVQFQNVIEMDHNVPRLCEKEMGNDAT